MAQMESDFELLEAWRAGDDAAGNRLVRRHFDSIYGFFESKLADGVDDLTQRTFLGCVEARERIREGSSFRAYLFGIARKQLLRRFDELRRDGRVQAYESGSGPARESSPSRMVARGEEQRVLLVALRTLPLDLRIAVELFYWEELPIADIAAVLEVPAGTVKSRLSRAKELLRARIETMALDPALRDSTLHGLETWARALADAESEDG
jgi:RNA polymerase sigma-70 factor (ECF subfamily)